MAQPAKRVLLATCDRARADLAQHHLSLAGFVVLPAESAREVRALAPAQPLHLALVDASLGRTELLELVACLRAVGPRLPILVHVTANQALGEEVMAAGATSLIRSWPAPVTLVRMVESLAAGAAEPAPAGGPPAPGQHLWLEFADSACSGRFPSLLLARQRASLAVAAPAVGGLPLTLPAGLPVTVSFGAPGGWYEFATQVIATTFQHRQACLLLVQPRMLNHQQRRRHSRRAVELPVSLRAPGAAEPLQAVAQDLSRGGLRVLSDQPAQSGAVFHLTSSRFHALGRCVWSRPQGGRHLLGLQLEPLLPEETLAAGGRP